MITRLLPSLVILLALATTLAAQTVRWEPSGGTLAVGQVSEIALVFENCEPKDTPAPPKAPGLTMEMRGRSENVSMVNFNVTKSVGYTFAVRLDRRQSVEIPAFEIETNKGRLRVEPARFEAGNATVGRTEIAVDAIANGRIGLPGKSVWAGEVFPLTYTLSAVRRYLYQLGSGPEWSPAPLAIEEWAKPEQVETAIRGEQGISVIYRTRAYVAAPGTYKLEPVNQLVNLLAGNSGFGFFQNPVLQQQSIASDQPELIVKPLPQPAPAGFNGAVGQFKLVSKVVPERAKVGEPITWTLALSGTGNWPDIPGLPAREVSKDFQVVQPQAKRTPAEGKIYDATITEDVVLVPTRAGTYALGPINFAYFDPKSGSYKTLTTEKVTVTIAAGMAEKSEPTKSAATPETKAESTAATPSRPLPTPPNPPGLLPTEPAGGSTAAPAPWAPHHLLYALLAPLGALLLFWGRLAWQRARAGDPWKTRRAARQRLRATLARLGVTQSALPLRPELATELRADLLAWQQDVAALWQIDHAAPAATALAAAIQAAQPANRSAADEWAKLWQEADRTLYRAGEALPADWCNRAAQALASKSVRSFSPFTLLLPRHLLPWWFAAALVALVVLTPAALSAAAPAKTPADLYNAGDFAAAAQVWRDAIAQQPTDWRARHNLGLALLQQDAAGEAAAQLAAAFVQHPRDPVLARQLALGCDKAGYTPTVLGGFLRPGVVQQLAMLASPAEWQRLFVAAAALAALAFGCWLALGYGRRSRWLKPTGWALLTLALLLAMTATIGLRTYGLAADNHAALVWQQCVLRSIPTEVETSQKTTALPAGSLGVVDKTFLGWVRLSFGSGHTGWVRKEDIVMLWR